MKTLLSKNFLSQMTLFILLIFTFSQIANAIDIERKNRRKVEIRKKHHRPFFESFTITLDKNTKKDSFESVFISTNRFLSRNNAVRFGLGFGAITRNYYNSDNVFYYDGGFFSDYDDIDSYELNISAQYLFYPSRNQFLNLYWGIGPIVSLHYTPFDSHIDYIEYPYDYGPYYSSIRREPIISTDAYYSIAVGGMATMGMEMFLTRDLSFLTEYDFTLQHEWMEVNFAKEPIVFRNQHNFKTSQFKFGLNFYFY